MRLSLLALLLCSPLVITMGIQSDRSYAVIQVNEDVCNSDADSCTIVK